MSLSLAQGAEPAAPSRAATDQPWRGIVFAACFLVVYITFDVFTDLSVSVDNANDSGGQVPFYLLLVGLGCACFAWLDAREKRAISCLFTPGLIALFAWVLVATVLSTDPGLSARRLIPLGAVTAMAAVLFLLPRSPRHMGQLFAIVCGIVLFLSYFGVIFLPNLSIHQASDTSEQLLAGDWRGIFAHKNIAAGIFAMTGFIGIYVARATHRWGGIAIFTFSALFLLNSGGKTSSMMFFATLLLSLIVMKVRSRFLRSVLILTPLLLLALIGIGSILNPTISSITSALPVDATFTGRDKIWKFALDHFWTKPWTGYGYEAFWGTPYAKFGSDNPEEWSGAAAHAHNAYLNVALTLGLPGTILMVLTFVFGGLKRFNKALANGSDPAVLMLMLQLWSFGLYLANLESTLLLRADPVWMTFLFAFFSLNYLANFPVSSDSPRTMNL